MTLGWQDICKHCDKAITEENRRSNVSLEDNFRQ